MHRDYQQDDGSLFSTAYQNVTLLMAAHVLQPRQNIYTTHLLHLKCSVLTANLQVTWTTEAGDQKQNYKQL